MRTVVIAIATMAALAGPLRAQEPDHAIHEELRAMLRDIEAALGRGDYDGILPLLDENIRATSVTQDVMGSRQDVSNYFRTWFGPTGYMKRMRMKLEADALTELSPDRSWGLVRGNASEFYEAKDGYTFDFATRWTAVVAKGADDRWRLRAIHFGTNHLDNPVLTRVRNELTRWAYIAAAAGLAVGALAGFWLGRRTRRAMA